MDRGDAAHEEDDRNVADLLLDQIEFANVILLNKVDLVSEEESKKLSSLLKALNPSAKVIETTNSQVDMSDVVSTGRFSFEEASRSAGWLQSLQESTPHTPETEEYGISSFLFKARRPFHPERIHAFMSTYFHVQEPDWSDAIADAGRPETVEMVASSICDASSHSQKAMEALENLKRLHIPENVFENVRKSLTASVEAIKSAQEEYESIKETLHTMDVFPVETAKPQTISNSNGFSRLKERFGNVLRSKGFIWLASRPDLCGEWSQAGAVLRFTVGGPWYASLPDEAWPAEAEARNDILKDFEDPHGDRRQELVFIGIDMDKEKLHHALEECLMKDDEAHTGVRDPFAVWPDLQDLLDGGEDDEEHEHEHEHEHTEDHGSTHSHEDIKQEEELYMRPGQVIDITDGACEAQEILDSITPGTTVIFHWDAEWHEEGKDIVQDMKKLITNVDTVVVRVDIGTHPANWSFAMEKVMVKPEARRPGAKPVLKNGQKWPCFTIHASPELQPIETIAGTHAVRSVAKIIASLPAASSSQSRKKHSVNEENEVQGIEEHMYIDQIAAKFPHIEGGAVELRDYLKSFGQKSKTLYILWADNSLPLKILKGLQEILQKRPETDNLYIADIQQSTANASLGKALGVKKPPSLLVFSSMKMDRKFDGPEKVAEALAQEFRTLPAATVGLNPRGGFPKSNHAKQQQETSLYDPPQGKQNRSGTTKLTPDGKMIHYFPNMPCLKCGNPWWSSDDWDALCVRCRWDCLTGGYDDNSKPLPEHKAVWSKYVESIKAGITPQWKGTRR